MPGPARLIPICEAGDAPRRVRLDGAALADATHPLDCAASHVLRSVYAGVLHPRPAASVLAAIGFAQPDRTPYPPRVVMEQARALIDALVAAVRAMDDGDPHAGCDPLS